MSYSDSNPSVATPGAAPRVVVDALIHRGELASIELTEATQHGAGTAIAAVLSVALLLLGGFAGTFALAAAVWQRPDRGLILGLVTLAYLLGSAALGFVAFRRLKGWQPFSETRRQFHEDCACINDMFNSGSR
jgi:uncharacterized membrane protein YqjE